MVSRRRFLQGSGAALLGSLLPTSGWSETAGNPLIRAVSAARLESGVHGASGIDDQGRQFWQLSLPERCHGGCFTPSRDQVLVFERRPGWRFHVINSTDGTLARSVEAQSGEHFFGHGIFSPNGRYLYATVNRYDDAAGVIAVYDRNQDYQRVATYALDGIGPHELRLHPDGETLVVALGGIETHPDYDRIKLNLDSMAPALILMDRRSGEIRARFRPSHHQLSLRHLDVTPNGEIYAGYQFQGPDHLIQPLVCRFREGEFSEVRFEQALLQQLNQYIASVAAHPEDGTVAVTAPRGGLTVIFDGASGEVRQSPAINDCAGVFPLAGGGYLVSSGQGSLYQVAPDQPDARAIGRTPLRWDNHFIV